MPWCGFVFVYCSWHLVASKANYLCVPNISGGVGAYLFGLFTAIFPDFRAGPGLLADALKTCSFIQQIFTECQPGGRHVSGYYG